MSNHTYYETMYILRPDIPEEEVENHLKKYSGILTEAGAEILDNQMRGKRRLAYPISKHKEGIYVQLSHNGDGQHIQVLEKAMRLSEDVIRYLTVKQTGPIPPPRATTTPDKSNEKNNTKSDSQDNAETNAKSMEKEVSQKQEIKEEK